LNAERPEIVDTVDTGILAVEPARIVAADHAAIAERRKLQESGALHITGVIDHRGKLLAPLQISGVGLFDHTDPEDTKILDNLAGAIAARLLDMALDGRSGDLNLLSDEVRTTARRMVSTALGFKPKVTVHLVRV
jgi:mRNA degradation ribonuclease J1/J2